MLRLEDISLQLGGFRLCSINLHIRTGEYRVLLGPTGTGKTVLLETIAGLHSPHQGKIFLDGQNITTTAPEKRHLGIVYQDYALFPHFNVFQNIAFGLKIRGTAQNIIERKILKITEFLRISHFLKRLPKNLSGGECQRVALARALVLKPAMLLLDEPLSAMDRLTRNRLRDELKRIHKELGMTIFHITHDLHEAFFLADQMAVMHDGNILQKGTPDELSQRPATRFVAELMGMKNFIPTRMKTNGSIEVQGMGSLDPGLLPPVAEQPGEILLTFPNQAVELAPMQPSDAYWWRGPASIVGMNQGGDQVAIKLALSDDTIIHTTFSQREISRFPFSPTPGVEVETGIVKKGLHLLPAK
jgi:ABC-type Fe3+/spermidine/putrescine transport system ATPase subunit